MSQDPFGGWRLSQEQLSFLEDLLSEAILEKAEARMRTALEAERDALKATLLEELERNGTSNGADPLLDDMPSVLDEEGLSARVENRLKEVFATRATEVVDQIRDELRAEIGTAAPDTAASRGDAVGTDDLRALEARLGKHLDEVRKAARAAEARSKAAASAPARTEPPVGRLALGGIAMIAVAVVAGWFTLTARLDRMVADRGPRLAAMSQEAESTVEHLRSRAAASDTLFREIGVAASEIRERVGTDAVLRDLVGALRNDASFVAATTGPPGPMGPVGTPPRVGVSPGRFSFQNQAGATVAVVGEDETGRGHAQIYGQSGAAVAYLGTDNGTDGSVRLRDTTGGSQVTVLAGRDSSRVSIATTRGQQAFIRTSNGRSAEMGVSNGSGDGGVMLRSQGGFGAISVNGMSVHDFAEVFELVSRDGVQPGTVMSIAGPGGRLGPSTWAYDPSVIGVVSGAGGLRPGLTIGSRADGSQDLPVAMSGQVYVRVNDESGPIQVGDLLVASSTPGVAMRGTDGSRTAGAVIGKAMETVSEFPEGEALARMFVMAR